METVTNGRGNHEARCFIGGRERYHYDFDECSAAKGWTQYDTDQDAWYFGVWVHREKLLILTFAEGDETLTTCATRESFAEELAAMAEFYGDPPPAFIVYDQDGARTEVYDTRPTEAAEGGEPCKV